MLNYLYALLESEARLAATSLGLDPGIGFLHVDTDARDSLACDLMEAVRPQVDAFLLSWVMKEPLKRECGDLRVPKVRQCSGIRRLSPAVEHTPTLCVYF